MNPPPSVTLPPGRPDAAADGPTAASRSGLDAVFRPKSIAVVGASRVRGSIGAEIFHNLLEHGFTGVVYPVNPKADVVQSVKAYPSVRAIPGEDTPSPTGRRPPSG